MEKSRIIITDTHRVSISTVVITVLSSDGTAIDEATVADSLRGASEDLEKKQGAAWVRESREKKSVKKEIQDE